MIAMKWDMMETRRPRSLVCRRPFRKNQRPLLERLEPRLAPANVDVLTYHYDGLLSGNNNQETILTPANVNPTNFGKLFTQPVDGQIYATPLYKKDLNIGGTNHNVAFVATEHDSVYAFDADTGAQLWQRSFLNPGAGITSVPSADTSGNVFPEYGITGTPFIDAATNTMYVAPQTKEIRSGVAHYVNSLRAIDIRTGNDRPTNAVVVIGDSLNDDATHTTLLSVPGIGAGSSAQTAAVLSGGSGYAVNDTVVLNGGNAINNQRTVLRVASVATGGAITGVSIQTAGTYNSAPADPVGQLSTSGSGTGATFSMTWSVKFNAWRQLQRPALMMVQGVVYVGFAGYNDQGAYHGWVVGYQASDLAMQGFINMSPNARAAGIWQSGGGLGTDGTNLFFATGNTFSGPRPGFSPADNNYGETVVKLTPGGGTLTVSDYFTPFNWLALDNGDLDLGSGGTMLLPDSVGSAQHPHLMVETGKTGRLYLIDRDNMGHNSPNPPDPVVQVLELGGPGIWGNPSFVQVNANTGLIFYHGSQSVLRAVQISNGVLNYDPTATATKSNLVFGYPGGQPIVSSNGTANAVVWDLQVDGTSGATVLHAYNAANLSLEFYASNSAALDRRDRAGGPVKFTAATETNGQVLVGSANSFSIYGLFPSHTVVPHAATNLTGIGLPGGSQIQLNWSSPSPNDATGIKIERSTNPTTGFVQVALVGRNDTTFTDSSVQGGTQYYYRIRATNQIGDSDNSNTAPVASRLAAPLMAVVNLTHAEVDLSWTRTGNAGYVLARSFNGGAFSTVFSTSDPAVTSYFDMNVATRGTYAYQLTAMNVNPNDTAMSSVVSITNAPVVIDHSAGFVNHDDLTGNGTTQFTNGLVRLTTNLNAAGSVFTNQRLNIDRFNTTWQFRIHDGTNPPADGFALVIQNNSAAALGGGGGGLGYSGMGNSVAIKFDMYTQATQASTTGLFINGDLNPAQQIDMGPNGIDLRNANVKQVDITYNGTTLHEVVTDTVTHAVFMHDYTVNIAGPVGSDTAFVGFTGATGGLSALQDIQTWVFTPGPGLPGAPATALAAVSGSNIALSWVSHSVNEDGFKVERSDNGLGNFREIASVTSPRFTDPNVPFGNFYYRVRAFNSDGFSQYSNITNIVVGPTSAFTDHAAGFASHADLQLNNGTVVAGTRLRLTDGGGGEAQTAWTTSKVGVASFSTSFIFQDQPVNGSADGITFALQNNDPGQVGGAGGCLGYCGIGKSVAIMFDLYSNGTHNSTTNLLTNGNKTGSIDMGPSGIVLGSNHPLRVDLAYDITQLAFSETVTDTLTGAVFTHIYTNINVPTIVQGQTAYVGFTGGTGGETAIQDIVSWSGRFLDPVQPVSHVALSAGSATAGTAVPLTVTARDALNNLKTDYHGTVRFATSDPLGTVPEPYTFTTGTGGDNGSHTFNNLTLRRAGTQTVSAQDTTLGYIAGSTNITVVAAPASQFAAAYPTPTIAGTVHLFGITAQDPYGNTAPTYRGRVHLTSSDPQAILSPDDSFTAGDNGTHTFSAVFFTGGTQTLTATDTQTAAITGTQNITVFVGVIPASFGVSGFPSPSVAGTPGTFTVTALNADGSVATAYVGTVHITSSDPQAALEDDYTFQPGDNGQHTFGAILKTAGSQTITATDTTYDVLTGTHSAITITPSPIAGSFVVTAFPSPIMAGTLGSLTVTVRDLYGNLASTYTGTVTLSSSDPQATLDGDYTFTTGPGGDNGVHTFYATLRTAGSQSITVTDTGNGATGTQDGIMVTPSFAMSLALFGYPSPVQVGSLNLFTVSAVDAYGNYGAIYTGHVITFSSTDLIASLPPDYTFSDADHGTHVFAAVFNTVGTWSLTATDVNDPTIAPGTQDNIQVVAGPSLPSDVQPLAALEAPAAPGVPSTVSPAAPTRGLVSYETSPVAATASHQRRLTWAQARAATDSVLSTVDDNLVYGALVDDIARALNG
jgi:hypothetical protein